MSRVGVVAIGRNEGERLRRCLQSLDPHVLPVVYVDSGSSDGSPKLARSMHVEVVDLDLELPFTAARARNAGFEQLLKLAPKIEYVQFVDGDCEIDRGWLPAAILALDADAKLAVVCGLRRERRPQASVYNLLCDLEWDTPVGEALACGGDALMRVSSLRGVGGYRDDLIAGEEPELCVRLRSQGGKIQRLPLEMTLHDANMTRLRQWWARNVRAGHAFAEVSRLHRRNAFGIWKREERSNWIWGLLIPPLALGLAWFTWGISFALLFGYPLLMFKIYRWRRNRGDVPRVARIYAWYCVLSKFPQMIGQARFIFNRLLGRKNRLIEYKAPQGSE